MFPAQAGVILLLLLLRPATLHVPRTGGGDPQ